MARVNKAVAKKKVNTIVGEIGGERGVAGYLEYAATTNTEIAWRPVVCAGYDVDEQGKKHFHHIEGIPCKCPLGPHVYTIWTTAFETLAGGGRGSGKSEDTFGFVMRGNPNCWTSGKPCDASYANHPKYTFLVIRKNSKDLDEWFRRFRMIVEPMGAVCTESPMRVRFPSGAEGSFGHMDEADIYEKYQGKNFTRIVAEEAGQIKNEKTYMDALVSSCRSATPELHPQLLLTANPGGPGARWLNARFRYMHGGVKPWPYGKTYTCPYTERTRVFIHSTIYDNPYFLVGNAEYLKTLEMYKQSDPVQYRRWLLGDFDAVAGAFFPAFRKERRPGEPENAVHVIKPKILPPWWNRSIGMDWGYSHYTGVVWGCWSPDKQLFLYRETKFKGISTSQAGAEVARMSAADLEAMPSHHMTVHLSHDCFARDGRETEAEQIARGINTVLGAGAAFIFAPNEDEETLDPKAAWEAVKRRQSEAMRRIAITLQPAGGGMKRRHGFNLMRDYMRWQPLVGNAEYNDEYAKELMLRDGALAYLEYKESFDKVKREKLPILQIFDTLPQLISNIEGTQEDPNNTEQALKQDGDDQIDSAWMLISGFGFAQEAPPRDIQIQAKVDAIPEGWGAGARELMREYHAAKMQPTNVPLSIPRMAGPSTRRMRTN